MERSVGASCVPCLRLDAEAAAQQPRCRPRPLRAALTLEPADTSAAAPYKAKQATVVTFGSGVENNEKQKAVCSWLCKWQRSLLLRQPAAP